ncbi:TetR/AcrR family transcriptional regulator [Nocardia sp. NPDC003693]
MTRAESKDRTRRSILDAAVPRFLDRGFTACSLEEIADAAGYSTGAVYSNFGGKTELAIEALDELYLRETERVLTSLLADEPSFESWVATLSEWAAHTIGEPRWARFEIELTAVMAGNDTLRPALSTRYARLREAITTLLQRLMSETHPENTDLDATATLLLGLVLGVALQRIADPEVPTAALTHGIELIARNPRLATE